MLRVASLALVPLLMLAACNSQPEAGGDAASAAGAEAQTPPAGAALRLSANAGAPSAAYLTLSGNGTARTLTSVASPDAERVEMHESRRENGMMTMASVERIEVPATGEVAMRPGGLHLMLFGVSEAARSAGEVTLNLSFADGSSETVTASTANLAALEGGPAAHGGDHAEGGDHAGH